MGSCKDEFCGLYSINDINNLSIYIKNSLFNLSRNTRRELSNSYNSNYLKDNRIKYKIDKLNTYLELLYRVRTRFLIGDGDNLNKNDLQCLVEKIRFIIGKTYDNSLCDLIVDNSQEELWVIKKPLCRSYQEWEKWSKYFCGKLNLEIKYETKVAPKLIFELSRGIISPNSLMAISSYSSIKNDPSKSTNRTSDEIKVDFKILKEKVSNFNMTLPTYKKMINNHKLSFDIIKTIYDNDLSLNLNKENIELSTPINIYNLDDIEGSVNVNYLNKIGLNPTITKEKLLQDYK